MYLIDLPDIDKGSHVTKPSAITRGNKRVTIGTPVYVYDGFDITIDCNIVNGTPPITIQWFRNGSPDPTRGNISTITITDASNGDVFTCRADNIEGFDTENTVINIDYGMYVSVYVCHTHIYVYESVCVCCTHHNTQHNFICSFL